MQQVVIIGCGDIGKRVAQLWYSRGVPVTAVTHNVPTVDALIKMDVDAQLVDLDRDDLSALPIAGSGVYYFAPPSQSGTEDSRIARWLETITPENRPKKIVYISTTGVYGDCQGEWVDENHMVNPTADRSKRRLDAERKVQAIGRQMNIAVVILRVAGIYGPERLPIAALKREQPVIKRSEAPYSNRIHQDDLAQICMAAMLNGSASGIFNVSDGEESTMTDYFLRVARALGLPLPREVGWDVAKRVMSPAMLSYLTESRRISNKKMLEVLKVKLRYPTLAEGLREMPPLSEGP